MRAFFCTRFGVLCLDGCLLRFHEVLSRAENGVPVSLSIPLNGTCGFILRSLDHRGELANSAIARNGPAVLVCSRNT